MSENNKYRLSWLFVAIVAASGIALFNGWSPVGASEEINGIRDMRNNGDIIPLSGLAEKVQAEGLKIIEAELERKHGRMIYELELLAPDGRVYERYYDAVSGEPYNRSRED